MKMKAIYKTITPVQPFQRKREAGVALLTVLALLSIFAVVLVGFTYTIRMEEFVIENYARPSVCRKWQRLPSGGAGQCLAKDLTQPNRARFMGRPQPRYVSLMDPGGRVCRTWEIMLPMTPAAINWMCVRRVSSAAEVCWSMWSLFPGIDEDPRDTTGQRQFGRRMNGDGFPGLRGVDDNFDFLTDPMGPDGTLPADDDEDFRG